MKKTSSPKRFATDLSAQDLVLTRGAASSTTINLPRFDGTRTNYGELSTVLGVDTRDCD